MLTSTEHDFIALARRSGHLLFSESPTFVMLSDRVEKSV